MCVCGSDQITTFYQGKYRKYIYGHQNRGKFKGLNHPNWKGERIKCGDYWYIWKPDHLFANSKGYVKEHRLVYEQFYNCCLLHYVVVHLKDGNKRNNKIDNLEPMYSSKHISLGNKKDMSDRVCVFCKSNKTMVDKHGYEKWHDYQGYAFTCHSCYATL